MAPSRDDSSKYLRVITGEELPESDSVNVFEGCIMTGLVNLYDFAFKKKQVLHIVC